MENNKLYGFNASAPSILFLSQFLCNSFSICKNSAPTFPQYISINAFTNSETVHNVVPENAVKKIRKDRIEKELEKARKDRIESIG
jgi:hypothetical protein